ncbi:MAG: signal peptide peptidase SppA [Deltaproteobacteria bacterium]|nr:signal peptide peptidase SppA [Deltaproteobacteria bacterium]
MLTLLVYPARANPGQEFPFSLLNPEPIIGSSPYLMQPWGDSPAWLSNLEGLKVGFYSREKLDGKYNNWTLNREGFFISRSLPFVKGGISFGAELGRTSNFAFGRFSLGAGFALSPNLSWGISYSSLVAPTDEVDGAQSFNLGLYWQVARYLALSWQVNSLLMDEIRKLPLDRTHRVEIILGSKNLLWTDFVYGERRQDWGIGAGLRFNIFRGINLFGGVHYFNTKREIYTAASGIKQLEKPDEFYFGGGLNVILGKLSWQLSLNNTSTGITLLYETKPRLKSIIPKPQHALFLDFSSNFSEKKHYIYQAHVRRCLHNPKCRAVYFKVGSEVSGWSFVEEWSFLVAKLKQAGKKVLAYGYAYSNLSYAMVAGADKIAVFPGGALKLSGLKAVKVFLGDVLKKIGVQAQFVRFNRYKSAPELFTRNSPGTENFSGMKRILSKVDKRFKTLLQQRDKFRKSKNTEKILKEALFNPVKAKKWGLIDKIIGPEQVNGYFSSIVGRPLAIMQPGEKNLQKKKGKGIALMILEGDIVVKKSKLPSLTGKKKEIVCSKVTSLLDQLAQDPRIGAMVIRINSPGGSSLASDIIDRKIKKISKIKPVVFSFSNISASGGYYIAANSSRIFATEASLTGSIGIYGGKFNLRALLAKAGVGIASVKQAPFADISSPFRPYTEQEIVKLRSNLAYYYQRFLNTVSQGRKISQKILKKLAGGRVWTGKEAKKSGLVDENGGLFQAIGWAKAKAGLSKDSRVYFVYPSPQSKWKKIIKELFMDSIPFVDEKAAVMNKYKGKFPVNYLLPSSLLESGPWARIDGSILIR